MHQCSVEVVCQQHPRLHVLAVLQQIGGRFQLHLIGLLRSVGKGGIAARLEFFDARTDLAAVCVDHLERRRRGVLLAAIHIAASLRFCIRAGQIDGRQARRLHDADGERCAVSDFCSQEAIAVRLRSQSGNIQCSSIAGNGLAALIARNHQTAVISRTRDGDIQVRKICRGRQEQVICTVHIDRRNLHAVYRGSHSRYICRKRRRCCTEDIGPFYTVVDLVFCRNLSPASRYEIIRCVRAQPRDFKSGILSGSQRCTVLALLVALEDLIIPRTGGRVPGKDQGIYRSRGASQILHIVRNNVVGQRFIAVVIPSACAFDLGLADILAVRPFHI